MAKYTALEKVLFGAEIKAAERARKEAEEKRKIENTGTQKTKTKEGYAEHNKKETKTRAEDAYRKQKSDREQKKKNIQAQKKKRQHKNDGVDR